MWRWALLGLLASLPYYTYSAIAIVSDDAAFNSKKDFLHHESDFSSQGSTARMVTISAHGEGMRTEVRPAQSDAASWDEPALNGPEFIIHRGQGRHRAARMVHEDLLKTAELEVEEEPAKTKKTGAVFFKVHRPAKDESLASLYSKNSSKISSDPLEEEREHLEENDAPIEWEEIESSTCPDSKTGPLESDQRLQSLKDFPVSCTSPAMLNRWKIGTGGFSTKIEMDWNCCTLSDSLGECTSHSREFDNQDGSIMNLAGHPKVFDQNNKIGCTEASGHGGLQGWRMSETGGEKVKMEWTCCKMPESGPAYGECKDIQQSTAKPYGFQLKDLRHHEVACPVQHALFWWEMKKTEDDFHLQWRCCAVAGQVDIGGDPATCRWVGDPHYWTFDGIRTDPMRPSSGFYWVVKNDRIQIQSYYQSRLASGDPMRTRGIAFGGKFLLGNKLVVKNDVNWLKSPQQAKGYSQGDRGRKILWNDEVLNENRGGTTSWTVNRPATGKSIAEISRNGRKVTLTLPLGVTASINQYNYYSDQSITMYLFPEGQGGQCGANLKQTEKNAPTTDSRGSLEYTWEVTDAKQNLFTSNYNGVTANGMPIPTIENCPPAIHPRAIAICRGKFPAGGTATMESFFDMCVLDQCNTPDVEAGEELATNDEEQGLEQLMSEDYNTPRGFKVMTTKIGPTDYAGATYCDAGFKPLMPKSKGENRMILAQWGLNEDDAVVDAPLIWLGAKKHGATWKWFDDTIVTASYTNWASQMEESAVGPYLCMDPDGKWKACDDTPKYGACEEAKMYGRMREAGPFLARSACGDSKQMAMPKNANEQATLHKIMGTMATEHKMWLGAHRSDDDPSTWMWEDGSQMGNYFNWEGDKPPDPGAGDYLCIKPDGKWTVCGATDTLDVLCEIMGPNRECPISTQDMSFEFMKMKPPPFPRAEFNDNCYYMAPGKMDCNTFCDNYVFPGHQGTCAPSGTAAAGRNVHTCKLVLKSLGITEFVSDPPPPPGSSKIGCQYIERTVGETSEKFMDLQRPAVGDILCNESSELATDHRICACKKAAESRAPPDGHVLTNGENIRIGGYLQDGQMAQIEVQSAPDNEALLEGKAGNDLEAGNVALKIECDPTTETITRNFKAAGKWGTPAVANVWPFSSLAKGESFSVDISPGETMWQISIMGTRYPNLDFPRHSAVFDGSGIQLSGVDNAKVSLLTNDVTHPTVMRSMNSANGCFDDAFELSADTVTFLFRIDATAVDGQRCLRCEVKPFEHSSNIYLENGKLTVTVEGNAPRSQIFDWDFLANTEYDIALSYVKADKVLELYVGGERKQFLYYTRAEALNMGGGQLGCYMGNSREFAGRITNYFSILESPTFRPLQARCSTYQCPEPAKRLKVAPTPAYEIMCAGSVCSEADTELCCDEMPKCNPTFTCSQANQLKHNAADIYCTDLGCTNTPQDHCCDPKGACTTYPCPIGKLHYVDALTIYCASDVCSAVDENKCCEPVAKCGTYDCPSGMVLKQNSLEIVCTDRECSSDDLDTCCTAVGTCDSYECPTNYLHKPNAENLNCADPECKSTGFEICCAEESKCSSYKCPTGLVHKPGAEHIFCSDTTCQPQDENRCCEQRGKCNTLICDYGFIHIFNASTTFCQGRLCTTAADHGTCCAQRGFCNAFQCPPGYRQKTNAASTLCDDQSCSSTSFEKCCGLDGVCSTYTCPATYVHKLNATTIHCGNTTCSDSDLTLCCDRAAVCSTNVCPVHMVPKPIGDSLYCQDRACSAADHEYCCAARGVCTSYDCPAGTLHRQNAQYLLCAEESCNTTDYETCCAEQGKCATLTCPEGYAHKDDAENLHCAGWSCVGADRDQCCVEVASCSTYRCPFRYFPLPNVAFLNCKGPTCTHSDLHTCCQMEGYCTNYSCPLDWLRKPAANEILCEEKDCNPDTTPIDKCCAETGRCNAYACPLGYVSKLNASVEYCEEWMCTDDDLLKCCDEVAMCSTHDCPYGFTLNVNHADIMCVDRTCSGADHDLCCVPEGHCYSFECPPGYLHRHDESLLCDDENCTNTNYTTCCAPEKKCNTYMCPQGYLHKDNSEMIDCAGFQCTDLDRDTCCDEEASCRGYACPAGTIVKAMAANIFCDGGTCTDENVLDCCTSEGKCDSYQCPPGFQHRHNANDIFCEGATCDETDYMLCCVEEGHCHTYHCPDIYVHKINASVTFCDDWLCRDGVDTDTCCDLRAHCNEAVCPTNEVLIWQAPETLCINRTCLPQDDDTCCAEEGRCTTMMCPPGYAHRHNAGDIFCSDKNCTETDYHRCCAEEDMCHSYSCPDRYVHKLHAETMECQGFVCDDTDRDTCCDFRALCNTYICDYSYVLKADAAIIQCVNSTCEAQDRDTCCDHQGTCLQKECPLNYVHKPTAGDILCPDMRCLDTDPNTCCQSQAQCLSHKCPLGYVQKESATPLYCAGLECNSTDTARCCDHEAKCNEFEPPPGYFLRHNAPNLTCKWSECGDIDLHTCAAESGYCSSYKCPETFILKHDAHEVLCEDLDCLATDYTHCCAEEGRCTSYRCPNTYVHKENAANLSCSNTSCSSVDETLCCQLAGTCQDYICPMNFVHRTLAPYIYCEGRACGDNDKHECCVEEGMCSSLKCPTGFLHRHDAHEIHCEDSNCSATDFRMCCAEEGHCPTYHCPDHFVQKNMSEDIHCREELCTDADKHICCDVREECSLFACGTGFEWKPNFRDLRCEGRNCKASDVEVCCDAVVSNGTTSAPPATTTTVAPATTTTVAAGTTKNTEERIQGGAHRTSCLLAAVVAFFAGLL